MNNNIDSSLEIETHKPFKVLENHLENREYVAGNSISIGDIAIIPMLHRYINLPLDESNRFDMPNIRRWYANVSKHPSINKYMIVELS